VKILIVDDERLAISRLERLLKEVGENDVISVESTSEAAKIVNEHQFDLFFLDINFLDGIGIELAYTILLQNASASIVFQTAHEKYALKAFEIGAIDYLLKPYSKEQVQRSVDRAKKAKELKTNTLMVRDGNEYRMVDFKEIYYVQADLSQTVLRTKEWFLYYPKKISELEELLASHGFFRMHRSYLINTSKIKKMVTVEQSRLVFYFEGIDEGVESSKDGAKLFRQRFVD
jgi:two-component system LytT family response regulator